MTNKEKYDNSSFSKAANLLSPPTTLYFTDFASACITRFPFVFVPTTILLSHFCSTTSPPSLLTVAIQPAYSVIYVPTQHTISGTPMFVLFFFLSHSLSNLLVILVTLFTVLDELKLRSLPRLDVEYA